MIAMHIDVPMILSAARRMVADGRRWLSHARPLADPLVRVGTDVRTRIQTLATRVPLPVQSGQGPCDRSDHDAVLQRLFRSGFILIAAFFGIIGTWSVLATLSAAVIASGQFVVGSSVKKVQHPTGGVVGELLVSEGALVAEGDLLVRLDETTTRAGLQIVVEQIDELTARRARLAAERDGLATMEIPAALAARRADPNVARTVDEELHLFQARLATREGQRSQLAKRIEQLQNEITGLRGQLDAEARETEIVRQELKGTRELYAKNLVPLMRLNSLERQAVALEGQQAQRISVIAEIEQKVAETQLQIIQIDDDLRAGAQKELRETDAKLAELAERRIAADDQLKRLELRAPISGYVHQLTVHTVGGVVTPAEPVMLIVPTQDELFLDVRVMPQDRDQIRVGQTALVRVHASNQRTTPELNGMVSRIAADVSKDAADQPSFYTVRISVDKAAASKFGHVINAGMQAEAFVETASRTPLQYLLRPLADQVARAFREH
jgi:HlyD family secretion protein